MQKQLRDEQLSRFLCLLLRHKPQIAGLSLDEAGWVSLPEFVAAVDRRWTRCQVTESDIRRIVAADLKMRYEIDLHHAPPRIRATYGHSLPVAVTYPEITPPDQLYHGTARRFVPKILAHGLLPMGRQSVHLTDNIADALAVGKRRDPRPAIIVVEAAALAAHGARFQRTPGGLYLVARVPPEFLRESLRA
jgi:putative RNA 2'-phosphotransferase